MKVGAPIPTGDLYDLGTWPRKYVKIAMLIAINARNDFEAAHATARELIAIDGGELVERRREARRLLGDCAAKHKPIAQFFGSDAGVRLMRQDSDLANAVMLAPLGVHDSFIVPESSGPKLEEVMQAELAKIDPKSTVPTPSFQSDPNQGLRPYNNKTNQGVNSNVIYIGVWGDRREREREREVWGDTLVDPPRTCEELAMAYLGFPF